MESASHGGLSFFSGSLGADAPSARSYVVSCVHHWQIDSPNGPVSPGTCKRCGEMREFRNSMYSSTWSRAMTRRPGDIAR